MTFWVFNIRDCKNKIRGTANLLNFRFQNQVWFINPKNRYCKDIRYGDMAIVYEVGKQRFIARFTIASEARPLRSFEKKKLMFYECEENQGFWVIRIKDVDIFDNPVKISDVIHQLQFIRNKKRWGSYFSGGIVRIWDCDFRVIMRHAGKLIS